MQSCVSFNLQILSAEKTFIPAISSAALYGRGVFTSLAVYNSKPFLWKKHWHRLQENSVRLGVDLHNFEEAVVRNALSDVILLNNLKTGRARLTFFDETPGKIWDFQSTNKTSLLITTAGFQKTKDELRLTVSPIPVNSKSPLSGIKSCNYMESLLALEDARRRGFDEAVRLNEKAEIVSASTANIFWVKDENIFTPPLETGCLAGTTRALVMENFPVSETRTGVEEMRKADEVFLTSAGIGICAAGFENAEKKMASTIAELNKFLDLQRLKA